MTKPIKLLIVAGARPNFMKVAPLIKAAQARAGQFEYRLIHTGQHYDTNMSKVFFDELGIPPPDYNLQVGSGSHTVQTAQVMLKFEPVVLEEKPDWVVVVGDVNSTVACTLVAAKLGVKLAHVEAGLRSFDRTMPEEINRLVTDSIADLLLTPSEDGDEHLRREGVPQSRICRVGNIMIDSLVGHIAEAERGEILSKLGIESGNFVYVTLHRPSNVDDRGTLTRICDRLGEIGKELPIVFPVHPRTRKMLETFGIDAAKIAGLRLVDPVGYIDSVCLTQSARFLLTDSGGLQEESTYFRTPCLTLRPNTERPVTVTIGSNKLTTPDQLLDDAKAILAGPRRRGERPPLWDGRTADRILDALKATAPCRA